MQFNELLLAQPEGRGQCSGALCEQVCERGGHNLHGRVCRAVLIVVKLSLAVSESSVI